MELTYINTIEYDDFNVISEPHVDNENDDVLQQHQLRYQQPA